GQGHAALGVAEGRTGHVGRPVQIVRGDGSGRTRARPVGDAVETALVAVRAGHTLSGAAGVHDPRIAREDVVYVDTQLGARVGQEVRHEDVGGFDELHEHLTPLGVGDVQCDSALSAVVDLEQAREAVDLGGDTPGCGGSSGVAEIRVLELDDVGSPVGEDRGRRGDERVQSHVYD